MIGVTCNNRLDPENLTTLAHFFSSWAISFAGSMSPRRHPRRADHLPAN